MISVHVKLATLKVNFVQKFEEAHLGNHLELLTFRHTFVNDGSHTIESLVSELRVLSLRKFLEVWEQLSKVVQRIPVNQLRQDSQRLPDQFGLKRLK